MSGHAGIGRSALDSRRLRSPTKPPCACPRAAYGRNSCGIQVSFVITSGPDVMSVSGPGDEKNSNRPDLAWEGGAARTLLTSIYLMSASTGPDEHRAFSSLCATSPQATSKRYAFLV